MTEPPAEETVFQRKLRERIESKQSAEAEVSIPPEFDDLVPDNPYVQTEADKAMDAAIKRIGILDAYDKYCGKTREEPKGRTESIMISCPNPSHVDNEPSAWVNTEKNLYRCPLCGVDGGDIYYIAAYAKGYQVPEFKNDGTFRELHEQIAADFGYVAVTVPGGGVIIAEPEPDIPDTSAIPDKTDISDTAPAGTVPPAASNIQSDDSDADVIALYEDDVVRLVPPLPWEAIRVTGSFLDAYLKAACVDDVPEEFHLACGLIALGFALGRDVTLYDSIPVYANLFICTLGRSGSGKSKAARHLGILLQRALPYSHDDPNSKGCRKVSAPGSAEVLIHNFQKPVTDPGMPKVVLYNAPVRGLIDFNEMSSLISRASRMGSAIKPTLMQFYDMEKTVSTSSMTTGVKTAEEPFASALTSTQPKALKDVLKNADDASGFLNRWAYVLGSPKKKMAIGGVAVDMTKPADILSDILGWAATFRVNDQVVWTEEAAVKFSDFFHSVIERDKDRSDTDMIVRIDLLMKKLVLLLCANEMLKEVPVRIVETVMGMYDYFTAGYMVPAEEVGTTLSSEIQNAIMNLAAKQFKVNGRGVTLRQIGKSLWRRNYSQKQLIDITEALVKMGFLHMETTLAGDRGRPTIRYKMVK